ncbi:hypothetical protein P4645_15355 [Lysinibacillus fusiformis]|uniref:hypothetical protein n=1 Tax=Lysinibacillus fusiformis TaxID=28031 RepID=UPI002E1AC7C3|nr:hypothetical protein [Lysinibacillus fusiformis]
METKRKWIEKLKELKNEIIIIENELFEEYGHKPKSPGVLLSGASESIYATILKLGKEGIFEFENLKPNDKLTIYSNHSGYDFENVFYVSQTSESITILDYVLDKEIEIPKNYIVEFYIEQRLLSKHEI